ncbi:MAG: hypothetical protein IKC83_00185 [Clostridia bacterium]|nr:hypothetical protein [Clostridia bacterium]
MESIHKIPVNEAFSEKCGCPMCKLKERYDQKAVWFLYEEGIMNPETRIETNKKGFCKKHLDMLAKEKQSLSLALMLETRLETLQKELNSPKNIIKTSTKTANSCWICEYTDNAMNEIAELVSQMYGAEDEFKKVFSEQEFFCLPHTALLLEKNMLKGAKSNEYVKQLLDVNNKFCANIRQSLSKYAESFDYKSARGSGDTVKDASKKAIEYMTGK